MLENIPAQAPGFGFKSRAGNILRLPGFELQTRSRVSRRRHDDSASLILPGHEFPAPRGPKKPLQLVVNVTPCPHSAVSYWFQPHGIPCLSSSSLESFGNLGLENSLGSPPQFPCVRSRKGLGCVRALPQQQENSSGSSAQIQSQSQRKKGGK